MMHYDKLRTLSPVNVTAARVVSRSGIQWTPAKKIDKLFIVRSDVPLPVDKYFGEVERDLTGIIKNRLTVIGLASGVGKNKRGTAWVVRCRCGYYEIRRSDFLRKGEDDRGICSYCDYMEEVKRGNFSKLIESAD